MIDKETVIENVIERIRSAFGSNEYPGENVLQGSFEGCEPHEEVGPFKSKNDWRGIEADFLDGHANALAFFSEAGFRYFLPAYLIADLHGQLNTADPLFHVTHGFSSITVEAPTGGRVYLLGGKTAFVNPRRYGGATWYDHARYRLSVFTREEASAIVAYLEYKRHFDRDVLDKAQIDAALSLFWLDSADGAFGREPQAVFGGARRVPCRDTLEFLGWQRRTVTLREVRSDNRLKPTARRMALELCC